MIIGNYRSGALGAGQEEERLPSRDTFVAWPSFALHPAKVAW
jgi:hypothetical protein